MNLGDREFLAPALEILETPPSPVHVAFLWIICALVVAALAWAYFGRVDIVAAAQGKFQPTGQVKVVEPLETGRVAAIRAGNGSLVQAGDVLVELDRSAALADADGARAELASARAEILRRKTALAARAVASLRSRPGDRLAGRRRRRRCASAKIGFSPPISGNWPRTSPRSTPSGRRRPPNATSSRQTIATQKNLVATLQERVDMRTKLVEMKAGAKAAVIDATETLQYQITQEAKQEQDLASLDRRPRGHRPQFRQGGRGLHLGQRPETRGRRAARRGRRAAPRQGSRPRLDHLTLRAPIAGRVQSSIITNVGQVVTSGQEIMRIVPEDSGLEIQAYVRNRDIGFVSVGQEAVVKVESFPFTRYGVIKAHVDAHRQGRDSRARRRARSRAIRRASPTRPALPAESARRIWCSRSC